MTKKKCHIDNKLYTKKVIRVRNHCHITGKNGGLAHPIFNDN